MNKLCQKGVLLFAVVSDEEERLLALVGNRI